MSKPGMVIAMHSVYRAILAVLVGLISMPALAGTVDSGKFCVTDTEMQFDVEITSVNVDTFDVFFGVTAEGSVYVAPVEVLGVNFDPVTGEVTRSEKKVSTYEVPEFDRWVDGPVEDFTIESLGNRQWRLFGTVALGTDKLLPGDKINMASMREFSPSVTAYGGPYTLTSCESTPPPEPPAVIKLKRGHYMAIDGELSSGEWPYQEFFDRQIDEDGVQAGWLDLSSGHVMFRADQHRLYVAVDILDDNVDDPLHEGGMDAVWLLFDVDGDGQVSEGVDVRYRLDVNTGNLLRETFATPSNGLSFNPALASTFSARASGFDCFTQDLSLFPTIPIQPPFSLSCNRHRVWEFAIDRGEIGAGTYNSVIHMAIAVQSGTPALIEQVPSDLGALGQYLKLELRDGYPFELLGLFPAPQMAVSFTQGIESYAEDIPVIRNKPAAIRLSPIDGDGGKKYKVALYGQVNGVDLPGSPLMRTAYSTYFEDQPLAEYGNLTRLPDAWVIEGGSYQAVTYDHGKKSLPLTISNLASTRKPTYWIYPTKLSKIGGGSETNNSEIRDPMRFVDLSFPVSEVDWVVQPRITSVSVDSPSLKTELQEMYDGVLLAWVFGLIVTGSQSFAMPDMILSATSVGLCSGKRKADCKKAGGSSTPVRNNGHGRVAWGNVFLGDSIFAHEIDHNLDRSSNGTWGRHVPFGCDAPGSDSQWPYTNDAINGFHTKILKTQAMRGGLNDRDFMTYCGGGKWISPYRWKAMLANVFEIPSQGALFTTGQATTVTTEVIYLSGTVGASGGGSLNSLIIQPGTMNEPAIAGQFLLRQLACDDITLSEIGFAGFFEDVEGGALEEMYFSFRLPKAGAVCSVQLLDGEQLLAERRISANPPTVDITAPAGGTHWDGMSTISWTANDDDGDSMQYMVFYSPDGGLTWVYLAGPISDTQLQVDSSILEGSTTAQVRVVATDGFNTSVQDTADPFSVEASGPRTYILSHQDLQKVVINQPLLLQGAGYRGQGSLVNGDAYRWFIDGEFAGIGEELTAALDLGEHEVELFVVGEDDLAGSDSVRLVVVPDEVFRNDFE